VNCVLCLSSTLTKKCWIPNSNTKFCNYTNMALGSYLSPTLQKGHTTVEWTWWRQHWNANSVFGYLAVSLAPSVWLLLVKNIWQPCVHIIFSLTCSCRRWAVASLASWCAARICGRKRLGVANIGNKVTPCCNHEVENAIQEK